MVLAMVTTALTAVLAAHAAAGDRQIFLILAFVIAYAGVALARASRRGVVNRLAWACLFGLPIGSFAGIIHTLTGSFT